MIFLEMVLPSDIEIDARLLVDLEEIIENLVYPELNLGNFQCLVIYRVLLSQVGRGNLWLLTTHFQICLLE